jgi:cyclase
LATRVIARIDVKRSIGAVKGRRMDGLRRVGDAAELALAYEAQGADEILMLDLTASLYRQGLGLAFATQAVQKLTTPLTYGGGIWSFQDFLETLRAVGEKAALCTFAFDKGLITKCAEAFGSQAVVVEVQVRGDTAYYHAGRQKSDWKALAWCQEAVKRGAGELLLTSVDRDGMGTGYDVDFIREVRAKLPHTVLTASGGCGSAAHCVAAIQAGASAVAVGTALHGGALTVGAIKRALADAGVEVRL